MKKSVELTADSDLVFAHAVRKSPNKKCNGKCKFVKAKSPVVNKPPVENVKPQPTNETIKNNDFFAKSTDTNKHPVEKANPLPSNVTVRNNNPTTNCPINKPPEPNANPQPTAETVKNNDQSAKQSATNR